MRLDPTLSLAILEHLEGAPIDYDGNVSVDGYTKEEISYHVKKLYEDGLVNALDASTFGGVEWLATDLTAAGHRQLQEMRRAGETRVHMEKRKVFVIHGRNLEARDALFTFLRSIDLQPLEWSQAVAETGKGSPYVGEVLDAAFELANAVVVLMTPDDEARLREDFQRDEDEPFEKDLTSQCRPNVLFEAGMAMGRDANRTVLVELGRLRPFSDVGGRHVLRFDGSTTKRQELARRLETAGCSIDLSGQDWHSAGDFGRVISEIKERKNKTNAIGSKSVESPVLTPRLRFNCTRPPQHLEDQCSLTIKFENTSDRTVRDFRIDIWFPDKFLNQSTMYAAEVRDKRTDTHRLFRILPDFNRNEPLFPGDFIEPSISYQVSDAQRAGVGLNETMQVNVFIDDTKTLSLEKPMAELVKTN